LDFIFRLFCGGLLIQSISLIIRNDRIIKLETILFTLKVNTQYFVVYLLKFKKHSSLDLGLSSVLGTSYFN
jgi:hypothetical protein